MSDTERDDERGGRTVDAPESATPAGVTSDGVTAAVADVPPAPGEPGQPAEKPAKQRKLRQGNVRQVPWALMVPAVAFVLVLRYGATIVGGIYAFTDWNGLTLYPNWIGFDNFRNIFKDPATSDALWHTLHLAIPFVILANLAGLGLALGLRRSLKTRTLLRSIFFLPVVLSELATAYIWQFIFRFDGPFNAFLGAIGLESWQKTWTADPDWAIYTILLVMIWQFAGLTMVIYLAGLESIPEELEQAAMVDGASLWMRFRKITLPLLAPAVTVCMTLTTIFALRVFDQVIALTGGGPVNATETLATQVYKQTFQFSRFGYGAALALLLTVLVAVVALLQAAALRKREYRL